MTLRVSDELLEQVRRRAGAEGRSMNDYVTRILEAAVNPDVADTEVQQIRERLARAGVLAEEDPARGRRPDRTELARARAEAGQGTPLSDLVSENRR